SVALDTAPAVQRLDDLCVNAHRVTSLRPRSAVSTMFPSFRDWKRWWLRQGEVVAAWPDPGERGEAATRATVYFRPSREGDYAAAGWRAELGFPDVDDEVVILCPDCW